MSTEEVLKIKAKLDQCLVDLEVLEDRILQGHLQSRDARDALPQLDRLRDEYGSLVSTLARLGKPVECDIKKFFK